MVITMIRCGSGLNLTMTGLGSEEFFSDRVLRIVDTLTESDKALNNKL